MKNSKNIFGGIPYTAYGVQIIPLPLILYAFFRFGFVKLELDLSNIRGGGYLCSKRKHGIPNFYCYNCPIDFILRLIKVVQSII